MRALRATLIDVGWGDSILLEYEDAAGKSSYGLVDSNDSTDVKSTFIFLKRFFDRKKPGWENKRPNLDFIILSHIHSDHGHGLQTIMSKFGTKRFWYPKTPKPAFFTKLLNYVNRSTTVNTSRCKFHQAIDKTKKPDKANPSGLVETFGEVERTVLWPPHGVVDAVNENNNSIVLSLKLDNVAFVLTGDAEGKVWQQIRNDIPAETRVFKVPHHGSVNGTFAGQATPWVTRLGELQQEQHLGISCHLRPHTHPDQEVVDALAAPGLQFSTYRTDLHYHITFATDGQDVTVKYSH
jgi:beta-lactamase superfamily II metal-dependent hydrolase